MTEYQGYQVFNLLLKRHRDEEKERGLESFCVMRENYRKDCTNKKRSKQYGGTLSSWRGYGGRPVVDSGNTPSSLGRQKGGGSISSSFNQYFSE